MNEAWLEKIEQYFNNGMSIAEKLLFESEMRTNEELSSYFNLYKEIESEMRSMQKNIEHEEALKASLKNLNTIYFKKGDAHTAAENIHVWQHEKKRPIKIWRIIAVAAAVTGIIVLSVAFYFHNTKKNIAVIPSKKTDTVSALKNDSNHLQKKIPSQNVTANKADTNTNLNTQLIKKKQQALFADNFKPDAAPENTEGNLEDAFDYYQQHRYAAAAEEFTTADINAQTRGLETDPKLTAFYADYYAGICYLATGKTTHAIKALQSALQKSPPILFQVKAEWYLSLAYLKSGEIKKATELLTKISITKENKYRLKATTLLDELTAQ